MVLHSSLSSFVASTRLIRPGVGANDSPDQSRQGFEQYDTSEVFEKVFQSDFLMACCQKILIFGIFNACISKIAYKSFENTKNQSILTRSHRKVAQDFFSRTLDVSYCSKL